MTENISISFTEDSESGEQFTIQQGPYKIIINHYREFRKFLKHLITVESEVYNNTRIGSTKDLVYTTTFSMHRDLNFKEE